MKFNELKIDSKIIHGLENMKITEPTEIQEKVIEDAINGQDIIGQAQTGTGKTAAFGIPILERIVEKKKNPQALIIAPTRELALQVATEINKIGQFKIANAIAVYGGEPISKQINKLKNRPEIIVGTPGRLMDHMKRRTIRLDDIETVILDEGDEMLNMGFIEDIETIFKELPEKRHTMIFSATMPRKLKDIAKNFMNNPKFVHIEKKEMTVNTIEQRYIKVKESKKLDALCSLLMKYQPNSAIVFGRTKRRVDELTQALSSNGFSVEGLHGDMRQEKRSRVLRSFRSHGIKILVATDVAARGLDISGVSHVFNFDLPQDSESYVHRIGRTGRAGKDGVAFTFVNPKEMFLLEEIENKTKGNVVEELMPNMNELVKDSYKKTISKLTKDIELENSEDLSEEIEELIRKYDIKQLLSRAIKMNTRDIKKVENVLTEEKPLSAKGRSKGSSRKRGKFSGNKSKSRGKFSGNKSKSKYKSK